MAEGHWFRGGSVRKESKPECYVKADGHSPPGHSPAPDLPMRETLMRRVMPGILVSRIAVRRLKEAYRVAGTNHCAAETPGPLVFFRLRAPARFKGGEGMSYPGLFSEFVGQHVSAGDAERGTLTCQQ
jgi:hypothetical protein